MESHAFFATSPKGMDTLLADELHRLGAVDAVARGAGVSFTASLEVAYRACLWSRVANRILLPLAEFPAADADLLYQGARAIPWEEHLAPEGTLAVDFVGASAGINHTRYGALRVKDAIVDRFREGWGVRPSVDVERPDLRVNVHLRREWATVYLDLSGESLHRRGYRENGAQAPLKENLAAAILLRAGWPEVAAEGGALVDLMCGSGTLPIEGAMMAGDIAPGLLRSHYGFFGWRKHVPALWEGLVAEAQARREAGSQRIPPIRGYDADPRTVRIALENAARAGVADHLHIERRDLDDCRPERDVETGLVVVNPPYGERMGEPEALVELYALLGRQLKRCFEGWRAAVITSEAELGHRIGLRARRLHKLYNGALACQLLHFEVSQRWFVSSERTPRPLSAERLGPGAEMFANRLRKNLKQLKKWAAREGVSCYRVYDADMPEYALAVDLYQGDGQDGARWVHVQEYQPPRSVDAGRAQTRLREALAVIPEVLETDLEHVFFKVRRPQKGKAQYERQAEEGAFHEVREGECRLLVNFTDYLDTGLFLDHRPTRTMLGALAPGRRFLNLFGYTGAATVHAAKGGAVCTTTVDMSKTYLDWARRNLALNGIEGRAHELIQADCTQWLAEQRGRRGYGLIFLDPPTFSNSKRMQESFDVQRDHVALIQAAVDLLEPDGVLIFSNNARKFKMDMAALDGLAIEDITRATLPRDFERNPRIHNCWRIQRH